MYNVQITNLGVGGELGVRGKLSGEWNIWSEGGVIFVFLCGIFFFYC